MSHSLHRLTLPVAMALALGGSALPAAASSGTQLPNLPSAGGEDANVAALQASAPSLPSAGGEDANVAALQQTAPRPNAATVRATNADGFDWGDAGIGAGAGIAVLLIGVGGTVGVMRRRHGHAPLPT
jgi:hypothetical protein